MRRIFVDCHVFDGKYQGTRTYLEGLYKVLIREGKYHFLLAASDVENLQNIFGTHDNVTYLKYKFRNRIMRLLLDAPFLILKNKADAAHFQYRVPPIKFCKYIVTVHDVLFEDFPQYFSKIDRNVSYWTFKWSARYSEVVLTVSQYSKQKIMQHLGIKEVFITTNGISEQFYQSYDKGDVQKVINQKYGLKNYIIYISRWEPRKNQDLLLRAFVETGLYGNYNLVFVGGHTFENNLYNSYFETLSPEIKQRITDLGNVDFEDMLLLLRGALLFTYPSAAEGFGIPPLEAIAANVATICSNKTSMGDFDFIGDNFFDPSNLTEFKNKLVRALQTDKDSNQEEKRMAIKTRYNWNESAGAFNEALSRRGI